MTSQSAKRFCQENLGLFWTQKMKATILMTNLKHKIFTIENLSQITLILLAKIFILLPFKLLVNFNLIHSFLISII